MNAGVDFFTSGDHIFWQKGFDEEIDNLPVIRPANLPPGQAGNGYEIVDTGKHGKVLIINLQGRVFLNERVDDPFRKADEILEEVGQEDIAFSLVDFHAEATSEKYAFGFYLDGRVGAILGTHTHVPTCDQRVLPRKSLYISDVGMTGIIDSVLGVEKEIIIEYFLTGQNQRFEWENTGTKAFRGVILDTQENSIARIDRILP
jgi:metallophosphoesterase (TIGR00282 family)